MTMLHQRDVRLVVHDAGEHVVCRNRHREPLTLAKRRDRLFASACLREQHRG